ncbi:MAG TPA: Na(+)-translocating NADH-quinone reductase subunit A [Candidatus Hydrogenedentes bacterium]|nr:Na(+)-translocating NADH-quinone reductase subunit A [Candidatus Hydrogenedentota bacterium]
MATHLVKRGLDLPIAGTPEPVVENARPVSRVAWVADDYLGLKPSVLVNEGDTVTRGQPIVADKRFPGVIHTAPAAGTVTAIHRGERRRLLSIVIELNDRERNGKPGDSDFFPFSAWESVRGGKPESWSTEEVRALLTESGLWPAFLARPFSKTPPVDTQPAAIFITASDTHPLAPPMNKVFDGRQEDLDIGALVMTRLTTGPVFFCRSAGANFAPRAMERLQVEDFQGPHPSGTAGVHINRLLPVNRERVAWVIGLQDLLDVGALFRTGRIDGRRIVALAGPPVKKPRLLRTRMGASLDELTAGELVEGEHRVISGSVFCGRAAMGPQLGWLGRRHNMISVLREGRDREFMGWLAPGFNKFSVARIFFSKLFPGRRFEFTTSTNGDRRAMVPIGLFERVWPMDILPTFLLRAIAVHDTERAEALGVLELDEEDVSLCTFVSPSKEDFGRQLRETLDLIEKEG